MAAEGDCLACAHCCMRTAATNPGSAGERIQVHRWGGDKVCYYSRKAIDHGTRSNYTVLDPMFHSRVSLGAPASLRRCSNQPALH